MIIRTSTRALGLAGLFSIAATFGALAQDNEEGAASPSIEDQLSLGEDPTAQPNIPEQPYTAETIGDWDLRCVKTADGNDPCQMYQLLSDTSEPPTPIAEFSLFRLADGGRAQAGATVVVPLETALQQQLTIVVDNGQARRYPFAFCNTVGCYARIGLTADDVASFKRGAKAKVSIVPIAAPDVKVEVDLSLTGFTAAFDKVSVIDQ